MTYNNMPGPEDMDIDEENGLLFISSPACIAFA